MTTRSLGRRLQRLEAKTGDAVCYVVVWESMFKEEKAEFIRSLEAEHGQEINFLFVRFGIPRDEISADREKDLVSTSRNP